MEAFAIVIPFVIAGFIYIGAKLSPNTPWKNAEEEAAQLRGYQETLRERVERGRREGWDDVMLAQVEERLAEVDARLMVLAKS